MLEYCGVSSWLVRLTRMMMSKTIQGGSSINEVSVTSNIGSWVDPNLKEKGNDMGVSGKRDYIYIYLYIERDVDRHRGSTSKTVITQRGSMEKWSWYNA